MRTIIFAVMLSLLIPMTALAKPNPFAKYEKDAIAIMEDCFEKTPYLSTADALETGDQAFKKIDALLNAAYKETMTNLKNTNKALADLLRADQRAWLKFVEKFCSEEADGFGSGGTLYYTMAANAKMRFWVERISYLRIVNRNLVSEFSDSPDED